MQFLLSFWPQLLILLGLIIVAVVLFRRLPHLAHEAVLADPEAAKLKLPTKEWKAKVKMLLARILAALRLAWTKMKNIALQRQRKHETAAVQHMFDEGAKPTTPTTATPAAPTNLPVKPAVNSATPARSRTVSSFLMRRGTVDKAERDEKVAELLRRAGLYVKESRMKDAEDTYIKAVTLDPSNAEIYEAMAEMYFAAKNMKDGQAALAEAIKHNPKKITLHTRMAELALEQENYKQALLHLEHALNLDKKNAARVAAVAVVHVKMKDFRNAFRMYEQAFTMDPSSKDFGLAAVATAQAMGKPRKAKEIIEELFKKYPSDLKVTEFYKEIVGPLPETIVATAIEAMPAATAPREPLQTTPTPAATAMPARPAVPTPPAAEPTPTTPAMPPVAPTADKASSLRESLKKRLGIGGK